MSFGVLYTQAMRFLWWKLSLNRVEKPPPAWFVPYSEAISALNARAQELELNLRNVAKQTEATRKKVYRDGDEYLSSLPTEVAEKIIQEAPRAIQAGDPPLD